MGEMGVSISILVIRSQPCAGKEVSNRQTTWHLGTGDMGDELIYRMPNHRVKIYVASSYMIIPPFKKQKLLPKPKDTVMNCYFLLPIQRPVHGPPE